MREPLPRERAEVRTIRPGDFTHITGFRRVAGVLVRPRRKEVRIDWAESHATYSFGTEIRVLRKEHAPGYVEAETATVPAPTETGVYVYDPEQSQVRAA